MASSTVTRTVFTRGQVDRISYWLVNNRADLTSDGNLLATLGNNDMELDYIQGEVTWNSLRIQDKTIVIKKGAKLTIKTEVRFATTAELIVEPGGRLELEGALLTVNPLNSCPVETEFMWGGVEVQGSPTLPQIPQNQGVVKMIYSTIEHAVTAIRLYGPTSKDTGGQLHVASSTFRNNITGVSIKAYDNANASYLAGFVTTTFITDNSYQGYAPPHAGVDMTGVQGVYFQRCTFKNVNTTFSNVNEYGYGIMAVSAGFKVYPASKLGQLYPSTFEGLYTGILVGTEGKNKVYEVYHTEFKSCAFGIHNSMVSMSTMLYNDFELGELPGGITQGDQFGIFLEGGISGMDIEGNEFKCNAVGFGGCPSTQVVTTGILASNLGKMNQVIRGNIFDRIQNGIVVNGLNSSTGDLAGGRGLYFVCNKNLNLSGYDFSVANTAVLDVIRRIQKDGEFAAGNIFSPNNPIVGNHFHNEEENSLGVIDYIYYDQGLNEVPVDYYQIDPQDDGDKNDCREGIPDFPEGKVVNVHEPGRVNLELTKTQFYIQKDTLNQLIDSYNTAVSSGNQVLMDYYRELITSRGSTVDALNQDILQLVSTDTMTYDRDEYLLWIDNLDNYTSDLWRAREYGSRGDWAQAYAILDNMSIKWTLNSTQQVDFDNIRIISSMLERSSVEYFMPYQLDTIRDIANLGLSISSTWGRVILSMHGEILPPYYKLCEGAPQQAPLVTATSNLLDEQLGVVRVAPNPSSGLVRFTLPEKAKSPFNLNIYDISGQKVHATKMINVQYEWDSANLSKGLYFYTLVDQQGNVYSGKIIIQ